MRVQDRRCLLNRAFVRVDVAVRRARLRVTEDAADAGDFEPAVSEAPCRRVPQVVEATMMTTVSADFSWGSDGGRRLSADALVTLSMTAYGCSSMPALGTIQKPGEFAGLFLS
jgi:hypothetical protein